MFSQSQRKVRISPRLAGEWFLTFYAWLAASVQQGLGPAELSPGQEVVVIFRLDNRSGRPLRVLGVTSCWGQNCRFGLKRDLLSVAAGASDLECVVVAHRPGYFNSQLHLFVDDGGTREIVLSVSGTARKQ